MMDDGRVTGYLARRPWSRSRCLVFVSCVGQVVPRLSKGLLRAHRDEADTKHVRSGRRNLL